MTRKQFEAGGLFTRDGKDFIFLSDKVYPCGTIYNRVGEREHYYCDVTRVTDEGFHYSTTVFGKRVSGFCNFAECYNDDTAYLIGLC